MLRQVIFRQLKKQTFRQQSRELIIAELQDLESGSDALIAQIDAMVAEEPLSSEEQAALDSKPTAGATAVSTSAPTVGDEQLDRKIARSAEAAAYNFSQGRFESAEAHYHDILQFVPQHVETLCNLGATKIRLNQVKEARNLFERAILSDETSARAQWMLGVACYYLEDSEQAAASLKKAMELEPSNPAPPFFLGIVHLSRGDASSAVTTLQTAVDLKPRDSLFQFNLALALVSQTPPDLKRAYEHYQEALKHGLKPVAKMDELFRKFDGRVSPQPEPVSLKN